MHWSFDLRISCGPNNDGGDDYVKPFPITVKAHQNTVVPAIAGGSDHITVPDRDPLPPVRMPAYDRNRRVFVKWCVDKVDAYGLLQRIRREFVEAELPLVGYRECPEGKCALIVWPQENLPPLRRSSLGMLMGVPKPGDGGLEMALGGLDECREVCLGGLARVSRNLHW